MAREHRILHAVDNTFLTPYYQRPLELGADMVIHSTTKYFDGHNATVGGAIVVSSEEQGKAIRFIMNASGMIMSPQVAFLTLQGCKTLSVRMERQAANALAIAKFLEGHRSVTWVAYPGLPSFPQHELAKRQASGFGAMLSFEVKGGVAAGKALMDRIRLWTLAQNLGSVESLITHPVTMTHADVEPAERQRIGLTDGPGPAVGGSRGRGRPHCSPAGRARRLAPPLRRGDGPCQSVDKLAPRVRGVIYSPGPGNRERSGDGQAWIDGAPSQPCSRSGHHAPNESSAVRHGPGRRRRRPRRSTPSRRCLVPAWARSSGSTGKPG